MPRGRALPGGSGVAQAKVWGQPDRKQEVEKASISIGFRKHQKATLDTPGLRPEPEKGASWTRAARGIRRGAGRCMGPARYETRGRESFNFYYRFQKVTLDTLGLRPEPEKGASWTRAARGIRRGAGKCMGPSK